MSQVKMMDENLDRYKGKIHPHFPSGFWQIGEKVEASSQINYTYKDVFVMVSCEKTLNL
jgi:hypothetical protein